MSNPLKLSVPEGVPYIDVEREFDFPVEAVFEAHRDPAMIANWLGPRGMKAEIDHYDFRTGGSYRYTHVSPDGERRPAGTARNARQCCTTSRSCHRAGRSP